MIFDGRQNVLRLVNFLLFLQGQTVNLPGPSYQFADGLLIDRSSKLTIFAASKAPIKYVGKFNLQDERETYMMASRWQMVSFNHQIENPCVINPCPRRFTDLVLLGAEPEELQC